MTTPPRERRFATIAIRNVGGSLRVINRPFFECDDGSAWAVPREIEPMIARREGSRVIVEITCPDDQFATFVSFV